MEEKARTERTPLIPRHGRRVPHAHFLPRRVHVLALVISLIIILQLVAQSARDRAHGGLAYEELERILLSTPDESSLRSASNFYTSGLHLAGTNQSQALWTRDQWLSFGFNTADVVSYDVYLNYPESSRLALLSNATGHEHVAYEAQLEEDVVEDDPTSGASNRVPAFHAYSADGSVTAQFVFVNYGTYDDFETLVRVGIPLQGKIALARYGRVFRGLKIARAEELGMVGVVTYTDPGDDGKRTEHSGFEPYPAGPARQPSSIQRGSVLSSIQAPGDPTTPGVPSKPDTPRQPVDGIVPKIPSLPVSHLDGLRLLQALNSHGPNASSLGWDTGGLVHKGVQYNIGPSPPDVLLNLTNRQHYVTTPIWNVIGVINGTIDDEVVLLGNHRDAWIVGGAGDPNSGSAALNEVARSLGAALAAGWKPLRTIVLASWDGEEYNLIGSTEWVEEHLPWLSHAAIAYVNVDTGTSGSSFTAAAAPLLEHVLLDAAGKVPSPNQTVAGQTVRDVWDGAVRTLDSGSDFTAFQSHAGVPSLDFGFHPGPDDAVFHYHSNFDSAYWMDTFGDPTWEYHVAVTRVWALVAARLVDTPVIPFNATAYATSLTSYLDAIDRTYTAFTKVSLQPLRAALYRLHSASAALDEQAREISESITVSGGTLDDVGALNQLRRVNSKYKILERQFLHPEGLDGRSWFKHTVFAPGLWTGYSGVTFPGLSENIDKGDMVNLEKWRDIITAEVYQAIKLLSHDT